MSRITKISLEKFYSPSGPLAKLPGYEFRPQQLEAALAVESFLRSPDERAMALEAPTGVGKTFAVLAPALRDAAESDKRILFLTASIALQEQVMQKDLPRLKGLLGVPFTFGILKGRSNYACLRRASFAAGELSLFGVSGEHSDIREWLDETETGDLAELGAADAAFLSGMAASFETCLGGSCPYRDKCFVARSYRRAQGWTVTVANYNLFFSHVLEGGGKFPVSYDWLVCDEAHRLADAARSSSSVRAGAESAVSLFGQRVLNGFSVFLKRQSVDVDAMRTGMEEIREGIKELFALMPARLPPNGEFQEPDEMLLRSGTLTADAIDSLLRGLRTFENRFMDGGITDRGDMMQGAEVMNWIDAVTEFRRSLMWCLSAEEFPKWAYWAERGRGEATALMSRPVVGSEIVGEALGREAPEKMIFASATLTLSGKFSFWSSETGIYPERCLAVESPFSFEEQMELLIGDVGIRVAEDGYDERMCRVMEKLCDDNGGRTLVLLSSMRLVNAFAGRMRSRERPYSVLVQRDMPQRELLKRFTEDETSILIGSASFREGVDIPGEGLTQVIIDRIPFPHPNDPLVRARDALEDGKGFVRVTLPTARMFLRQAVGRLIRSSRDHGRVVLLDARAIERRNWGILSSLPKCRCRKLTITGGGDGGS